MPNPNLIIMQLNISYGKTTVLEQYLTHNRSIHLQYIIKCQIAAHLIEPLAAAVSHRRIFSAAPKVVYAAASRSEQLATAYDSFRP